MRRSFFWCERAPGTTVRCRVGKVGAPGFLGPQPSGALSLPRLRVPARAGLFCGKAPHRLRLCELCGLDSQKRTLGDDVYRDPEPPSAVVAE